MEKAKGKLEKQLRQTEAHYEAELENLRKNYDSDLAELKASQDNKIETAMKKVFEEVNECFFLSLIKCSNNSTPFCLFVFFFGFLLCILQKLSVFTGCIVQSTKH